MKENKALTRKEAEKILDDVMLSLQNGIISGYSYEAVHFVNEKLELFINNYFNKERLFVLHPNDFSECLSVTISTSKKEAFEKSIKAAKDRKFNPVSFDNTDHYFVDELSPEDVYFYLNE